MDRGFVPIVRLLEDALSASRAAMPSKRDMSAGQAKAVVAITNKIERDIRIAHWAHEMVSIQPVRSFESRRSMLEVRRIGHVAQLLTDPVSSGRARTSIRTGDHLAGLRKLP